MSKLTSVTQADQLFPTDRRMLDILPVGLVQWIRHEGDADSLLHYANKAWFELMGLQSSLMGRRLNPMDLIYPEDRDAYLDAIECVNKDSESTIAFVLRVLRADGSIRWVKNNATGFRVGSNIYRTAVLQDVTAEKLSEEARIRDKLVLNTYLEALDKHLIINRWNDAGTITYANNAFLEYTGYSREEIVGSEKSLIRHEEQDQAFHEAFTKILNEQGYFQGEWKNRSKSGRELWSQLLLIQLPSHGNDEAETLAMRVDITPLKDREAELVVANEKVKAADFAKTHFLNNISHEMRTPLNGLLGYARMLKSKGLSEEQRALLGKMDRAGQTLLSLINDVLDFSKIQNGDFSLHIEPVHLMVLLKEAAAIVHPLADAKQLPIELLKMDPACDRLWLGDPQRLRQILVNLLSNAVKFTSTGMITLGVRQNGDFLEIDVSDTGVGIKPEDKEKLFNRFSQVDESATRKYQGSGLGLAICKALAQHMGGDVLLQSVWGKGSTFTVRVKLEAAHEGTQTLLHIQNPPGLRLSEATTSSKIAEYKVPNPPEEYLKVERSDDELKNLKILVVDDSEMNVEVLSYILEGAGATVISAKDGQEAVDCVMHCGQQLDMILMDLHMPGLDGIGAAKLIRAIPELSDLPIIAVTAGGSTDDKEKAKQAGMDSHILKPYDAQMLIHTIKERIFWSPSI